MKDIEKFPDTGISRFTIRGLDVEKRFSTDLEIRFKEIVEKLSQLLRFEKPSAPITYPKITGCEVRISPDYPDRFLFTPISEIGSEPTIFCELVDGTIVPSPDFEQLPYLEEVLNAIQSDPRTSELIKEISKAA